MSQFDGILNRIRDVLYEPIAKIILSYTKFFKDLMKVFAHINSYVSRYYVPRTFAPSSGFSAPMERVREEVFEPLQRIEVLPRISYTINLLKRVMASRQATVQQNIVKEVEVPEGLGEAYKIMGESVSHIMQLEKSVGQYVIGKKVSEEVSGIEYGLPEHAVGEETRFGEKIVSRVMVEGEAKALEEKTIVPQAEVVEKPSDVSGREKMLEIRQEWSEPFKYIGNLMNVLKQLGSQLPVTGYFIPTQFTVPLEAFTRYYMFSPLKETVERLEGGDLMLIQALAHETFKEYSVLEENIPAVKETLGYPVSEYKSILGIPYIISYFIQAVGAQKLQEMFFKTLSYSLQQTYSSLKEEIGLETVRSAFTSTPLTQYNRLLGKEYPFYIHRTPEIAYMLTLPYIGSSILAEAYKKVGREYVPEHETFKIEEFAGKAVFTKVLNILETLPALVQETETVKYVGLEAYYPLSTMSKNFLQNLIQLYDRLLYEVKVVRPSEPSPMVTAASQFLETSKIFMMAEEEARRETLPSTLKQPYTIQQAYPSRTLMEREIQNIFNITVPEGAEVDMWELERKITQILREQFRRYYGPIF